ncbi:MAG: SIS domain-containing protein [Pyrinomonadaceae bacterium]
MTQGSTSDFLYPFLHGERQDAGRLDAALIESVRQKADDGARVKDQFFSENAEKIVTVARVVATCYETGGKLLTMGNGGSSCDAAHVAVEFQHPVTAGRPALTAVNLVSDMAMITAVGNDVGFGHIFTRQVIALGKKGDALIGISTSGNSENLINAFGKAKEMGIATIGLAGGTGGNMLTSPNVDHCLVAPTDSIHRVQECHVMIYHILWDLVHTLLADKRGGLVSSK